MNPAGIVIAIAGVWIISQVMAGNALQRLNLLQPRPEGSGSIIPDIPGVPNPGDLIPGGKSNPSDWWNIPSSSRGTML